MAVNLLGDGGPDGTNVCAAGSKTAFYGAAPVAIRTSTASFHQASWVSISTNITVGSALAAFAAEVAATFQGLGIWV